MSEEAKTKSKKSKKADDGGAEKTASKKKAARTGSNVFAMFTQHQVQEFKEAFQFIDQDKDGFISKNDIRASFDALGRICSDSELNDMVSEAPGPINFTMFLTIFGDKAQGTDEEDVILNAFAQYDDGNGKCPEDKLRHHLMTWGERFTKEDCDIALAEAPISGGMINIKQLAQLITRGEISEEAA